MRGDICSIYIYICFCFFLFIAHAGLLSREPADKSWGQAQKYLAESPLNGPWISSVQIPWGNHLFTSVFSLRFCQPDFSTGNEIAERLIRINKSVIQCNMWQVTTVTQNRQIGLGTTDFMLLGSTWLAVEVDIGGWYPATTGRSKRYVYRYVSYLIFLYQYIYLYINIMSQTGQTPHHSFNHQQHDVGRERIGSSPKRWVQQPILYAQDATDGFVGNWPVCGPNS